MGFACVRRTYIFVEYVAVRSRWGGWQIRPATLTGTTVAGIGEIMEAKTYPVTHTDEEWKKLLTPDQYYVLRRHGTEAPGSCALNYEKRHGTFKCAGCGQPLFVSKRKFDSGTGWPSFNDPEPGAIETSTDKSHFMVRTEVHCSRCGGHLGHVFKDGPPPTHLRYCINGVALNFEPEE
jgi:peptide-methionine (R)-S-oxide reductase